MLGEQGTLPRSKVRYINYIHSIGCNILGLKSLWYTCLDGGWDIDNFYQAVAADLVDVTSCDGNYNQLALIQMGNTREKHHIAIKQILPVVFTRVIKGGHGNGSLTLYGIDLTAMAPECRHNPVPPGFLEGEEDDD